MIRFAASASRHGINRDQIRYVIRHCGLAFDVPPPPDSPYRSDRILYLGDDAAGAALEVLAIVVEGGHLLVFHAGRMRAQYRKQYEEALKCRI
ncbi:MAG: hypothetical protein J2P45_04645 [Candidatus Dormibacteraeota bacterium]|nr:hypothetical protein [Candidatus Dormibacteraeota bacterium]